MANIKQGSKDNPVQLDPYQLIVKVQWPSGGVVVLEVEYLQGVQGIEVMVLTPEDITTFTDNHFTEIFLADYKDDVNWYAKAVGDPFIVEEGIVTEDEITDIWLWDGFIINALGDDDGVAEANITFGAFKLHFEGMQVAYDTATFGRPMLGNYVEHVHPNGHRVTYANGATPLGTAFLGWHSPFGAGDYTGVVIRTSDPNGLPPEQDLSLTESWYWYHLGHAPGMTANKIRQAWLVYFASDRTHTAELLNAYISTIPEGIKYNIRGYPTGTGFNLSQGHITPKPDDKGKPIPALWEVTETAPATLEGPLKKFSASGLITS